MRALVLSDTHFGAWTGEDILSRPGHDRAPRAAPRRRRGHLPRRHVRPPVLVAARCIQRRRRAVGGDAREAPGQAVRVPGRQSRPSSGQTRRGGADRARAGDRPSAGRARRRAAPDRFLSPLSRAPARGVEIDVRYPTYTFAGVLCTHGHYLDFHARRTGAAPGKLLARVLWAIAVGGKEHRPTVDDYEATITMLTAFLYLVAQLPNGTHAQQRAFEVFQRTAHALRASAAPMRAVEHAAGWLGSRLDAFDGHLPHAPAKPGDRRKLRRRPLL